MVGGCGCTVIDVYASACNIWTTAGHLLCTSKSVVSRHKYRRKSDCQRKGREEKGGCVQNENGKKKGVWSKINQIDIQSYIYIFNVVYGGSKSVAG